MMNKKRDRIDVIKVSSKFHSKKGQITIFIILGILMLLILVLVIFLNKDLVTFELGEVVPTEKGKVESFIINCMDEIGDDALFKIGTQGGYIEVPKDLKDPSLSLKISPMNYVPYWAHGINTNIPSLLQIEERIDNYMEENLRACLFGTEAFQETYDLTEKSDLVADTEIVDSKVIFNVKWDIEISNKGGEVVSEIVEHVTESPVKLKRVHQLAEQITLKELESLKLEDITQDLIALEHPDLPVVGVELSCNKKTWNVESAKETLLNLLRVNIKQLKVKNVELLNFPDIYYPEFNEGLTYYENHYVWDLGSDFSVKDVTAVFNFDSKFPYTFAVTPVSGSKMKSSNMGGDGALSLVCIQTWKFTYDMIYPVVVGVRDETTGYDFNFAFTVHLVQNKGNRQTHPSRPSYFVPSTTDDDYCAVRNVPMTVKTYELVENGEGVSYREDLGGVNLSFACLRYSCDIGQTEYDFNNLGYAGLITNYPYCVGGILRGVRGSYKENFVRVVTAPNKEVELDLVPTFSFPKEKIRIVKHEFIDESLPLGPAKELSVGDIALIKLDFSKTNETVSQLTHEINFVDSKEIDQTVKETGKIDFLANADFTYDLDVTLLDGENFMGGYKGQWTIPWNDLQNAQEIVLHVFSKSGINSDERAELFLGLNQYSVNVPVPEIK